MVDRAFAFHCLLKKIWNSLEKGAQIRFYCSEMCEDDEDDCAMLSSTVDVNHAAKANPMACSNTFLMVSGLLKTNSHANTTPSKTQTCSILSEIDMFDMGLGIRLIPRLAFK